MNSQFSICAKTSCFNGGSGSATMNGDIDRRHGHLYSNLSSSAASLVPIEAIWRNKKTDSPDLRFPSYDTSNSLRNGWVSTAVEHSSELSGSIIHSVIPPPGFDEKPMLEAKQDVLHSGSGGMVTDKIVVAFEGLKRNININQVTSSVLNSLRNESEPGDDVSVEIRHSNTQKQSIFILSGWKTEQVMLCRRLLLSRLMAPITETLTVPPGKRGLVLGPGGRTLSSLAYRYKVRVEVPRAGDMTDSVQVTGDPEGVDMARTEIFSLISESRMQIPDKKETNDVFVLFERSFLPWIGKYLEENPAVLASRVQRLLHYRIVKTANHHEVSRNVVLVETGSHESLLTLELMLSEYSNVRAFFEEAVRDLIVRVARETQVVRTHVSSCLFGRLVGKKGIHLKHIFEETRCSVCIPSNPALGFCFEEDNKGCDWIGSDEDQNVMIRGSQEDIPLCLAMISALEKDGEREDLELDSGDVVSESISVPAYCTKYIVGKGGKIISSLRRETNTKIEVLELGEETKGEVQPISVSGKTEQAVKNAVARILKIVSNVECSIEKTVSIPRVFHRSLIGIGGIGLQSILKNVKGRVRVSFPKETEINSDRVVLCGPQEDVDVVHNLLLDSWHVLDNLSRITETENYLVFPATDSIGKKTATGMDMGLNEFGSARGAENGHRGEVSLIISVPICFVEALSCQESLQATMESSGVWIHVPRLRSFLISKETCPIKILGSSLFALRNAERLVSTMCDSVQSLSLTTSQQNKS